jgi:transcriptional regulator NrdR family protein
MNCPMCGGQVKVHLSVSDPNVVIRRRQCLECSYIFYTTERELNGSHAKFNKIWRSKQNERLQRTVR